MYDQPTAAADCHHCGNRIARYGASGNPLGWWEHIATADYRCQPADGPASRTALHLPGRPGSGWGAGAHTTTEGNPVNTTTETTEREFVDGYTVTHRLSDGRRWQATVDRGCRNAGMAQIGQDDGSKWMVSDGSGWQGEDVLGTITDAVAEVIRQDRVKHGKRQAREEALRSGKAVRLKVSKNGSVFLPRTARTRLGLDGAGEIILAFDEDGFAVLAEAPTESGASA